MGAAGPLRMAAVQVRHMGGGVSVDVDAGAGAGGVVRSVGHEAYEGLGVGVGRVL